MGVIKTCSEYLEESVWGGILDKGAGESIKKEDEYNPDYIDFGNNTTVYWAENNLIIDGDPKFKYNWINGWLKYNGNGWRLPTQEEVDQLKWKSPVVNLKTGEYLFPIGGRDEDRYLIYTKITNYTSTSDRFMTKDESTFDHNFIITYGFDNVGRFKILGVNKEVRMPVFLVKDKK